MSTAGVNSPEIPLILTGEERELLLNFLEQALREKQIEVHRTEAFKARALVQHQEDLLRGLLDKLRRT
jgi:hypothetical protein